jgi:hypothetical protein
LRRAPVQGLATAPPLGGRRASGAPSPIRGTKATTDLYSAAPYRGRCAEIHLLLNTNALASKPTGPRRAEGYAKYISYRYPYPS